MSGGHWNYNQCSLGYEMFPGSDVCYGLGEHEYDRSIKEARKRNPMHDKQLSELVFDVLCLVYSADWCISGDTGEDTYRADIQFFKSKWLKQSPDELIRIEIDKSIAEAKEELYAAFGLKEEAEE